MSFMKKVFGSKAKKTSTLPEAIIQLKQTESLLLKKQCHLEEKIKKEVATARKNAKSNKKAATEALKRKKRYEKQLQQVDGALTTIEGQREVLEGANINSLAVGSMQNASKALKKANQKMDAEKVDQILENLAMERDKTEDIAEVLSKSVGFNESDLDDEEMEKELAELTADLENVAVDDNILPSVPPQNEKAEEKKKKEKVTLLA